MTDYYRTPPTDDELGTMRDYAAFLKMQLAALQQQQLREEFARSRMQEESYRLDETTARISRRALEQREMEVFSRGPQVSDILAEIRSLGARMDTFERRALPAPQATKRGGPL